MATDLTDLVCNKIGCTLAQTGKCVLDHDPEECKERIESLTFSKTIDDQIKPLTAPQASTVRFSPSYTLSPLQVDSLMAERYCTVIGILGAPGTGKTASLVSLYLMLAHGRFPGFEFRDSKTLMAFEEICQGARTWNEKNSPEKLTAHTELPDERNAGFLHLRLKQQSVDRSFDFLLPDLPGEWTDALVDLNRTDRLSFLKASESVWLMINGQDIQTPKTRHATLHRLTLLIQRLSEFLSDLRPALVLVVTHKDQFTIVKDLLKKVIDCAAMHNFPVTINEIASFSDNNKVAPGDGISELIKSLVENSLMDGKELWPGLDGISYERQFMNFGKK